MRDHNPVVIEEFNGLFARGDHDAVPLDHFFDCENIQYAQRSFKTRDGLNTYRGIANPVRMYKYNPRTLANDEDTLLILNNIGEIYHVIDDTTTYGPILTIPDMLDFNFVNIAGYAYITPFQVETNAVGMKFSRALQTSADGWVYVYKGDGTAARKAAGAPPTAGSLTLANGAAGNVEAGIHIIGVLYETDTGFLTKPARLTQITASGTQQINVSNIPVSPDSFVTARRLVATAAIDPTLFTGNLEGYQLFFVPDGRIADNVTTSLNINFYDVELVADASHLLDIMEEIPSTIGLTSYHGRMIAVSTYEDISIGLVSYPGEQEAIDAVSGLFIIPLNGYSINAAQEFRDVLYVFKNTSTYSVTDNGGLPSSWPVIVVDQGIGAPCHGVAQVLDSGGVNLDFLMIADWSGLMLFNGFYERPDCELTWKIEDFWLELDRGEFVNMQVLNDSLGKRVYITLPDGRILYGDYKNALTAKDIKWAPWRFDVEATTICLVNGNTLLIGSVGEA